jgi:hypothetical protein
VTDRIAGLLGRLPALIPESLHEIEHYFAGSLPQAPASVAVPSVPVWGMGGNDTYGDCGVIGLGHGFMAAAGDTAQTETFPDDAQDVSYYLAYTGGEDDGVVLSAYLGYVRANGFYGHTVGAYVPVNAKNLSHIRFSVWAYDFCYSGISVTAEMMTAFSAGEPWTLTEAQGTPVGGHCVPVVGYDSQYLYVVTWGAIQPVAWSAWDVMTSEAWAVLTGELTAAGTDGHGLNLAALQADLARLN